MEHKKDFNKWHKLKAELEENEHPNRDELFFHEREIWWASIGVNVGHEQDGKNINFERPILILKKFNRDICWIIPLTSKNKENQKYYYKIKDKFSETNDSDSVAILTQIKLISSKRLLRKIDYCPSEDFKEIINRIKILFP